MHACMKRRLLYAASQAYQPGMKVQGREVGWLEPPTVIRRGVDGRTIDQALVGRVAEGTIVAFRGSLPPFAGLGHDSWEVLLDWANNGMAACVKRGEYSGGVHMGFADSVARLWRDAGDSPGVLEAARRTIDQGLLDRRSRPHLFVTGHSKGGALANLFAWRAAGQREWREVPVSVATIAAARAGNAEFAEAYDASRIACLRYELASDLVPHLPPGPDTPRWIRALIREVAAPIAAHDWRAVGQRVSGAAPTHMRWAGSRRRLLPGLLGRRGPGLDVLIPGILAAHAITPDSAYDRLVCTGEHGCRHGE